jgi:hypothetical protein
MDELALRYVPMIEQIADMNADRDVYAQLRSLVVRSEEWDPGRVGGHFWFSISAPPAQRQFEISASAEDSDGVPIDIILHAVNGMLDWGEWYRVDGGPVLRWPPTSVRPGPNFL